jgi:hypothetical protein
VTQIVLSGWGPPNSPKIPSIKYEIVTSKTVNLHESCTHMTFLSQPDSQDTLVLIQRAFPVTVDQKMRVSRTAMRRTAPVDSNTRKAMVAPGSEIEGASSPTFHDQHGERNTS